MSGNETAATPGTEAKPFVPVPTVEQLAAPEPPKKLHWTQTPEGRKAMSRRMKREYRTGKRVSLGWKKGAKMKGKTSVALDAIPDRETPKRYKNNSQHLKLLYQAIKARGLTPSRVSVEAGYSSNLIQSWHYRREDNPKAMNAARQASLAAVHKVLAKYPVLKGDAQLHLPLVESVAGALMPVTPTGRNTACGALQKLINDRLDKMSVVQLALLLAHIAGEA